MSRVSARTTAEAGELTRPMPADRGGRTARTSMRGIRQPAAIAIVLGLLATAVSATGSWIPSLWGDEAATLLASARPVSSLPTMLFHVDAVHGLYYLGMHGWIQLAGDSPFALRFPSAVAIGLAVAAITLLAGRKGGPAAAILTGVVAAVLPRMTYAGEEARSFAFTAAGAAWLTLLLVWLIDGHGDAATTRARRGGWIVYGIGLAVTSYLFLYFASIVLAFAAIVFLTATSRAQRKAWAVSTGCALLSLTPLGLLAFFERGQISYLGTRPDDASTYPFSIWFGTPLVAVAAWVCIAVAVGAAFVAWRRAGRGRLPLSTTVVALSWFVIPTAAMMLANLAFPLYTERYSTFAAPAAALLIAEGILVIGRLAGRLVPTRRGVATIAATVVVGIAFVVASVPAYLGQRGPYSKNGSDWAEVSAAVGANAHPGDAVVFDESTRPSQRPRLAMRTYAAGFAGLRDVTLDVPYTSNNGWADRAYTVPQAAARGRFDGVSRVWLIELVPGHKAHTYGLAGLEALGFRVTGAAIRTHRTEILQLAR